MLHGSWLGREAVLYRVDDPPGGWACDVAGRLAVELAWGPEGRVEANVQGRPWWLEFGGTFRIRGALVDPVGVPRLEYAGGLGRGAARTSDGETYVLVRGLDRAHGPWLGFDDAEGGGVLRIRERMGGGGIWTEVHLSPDPRHARVVGPLLVLFGGLRLLGDRRRWLRLTTLFASERGG